jgi:hypothetical protein
MMENQLTREDGEFLHGLRLEILGLRYHWQLFTQLYSHSDERVETLKGVADEFFGVVEQLLWDHVLLVIGKLLDRAKTGGQENLNFESAIDLLSHRNGGNDVANLKQRLDTLRTDCELVKKIRHKRLAHFDKTYMIERLNPGSSLPGVNFTGLQKTIFEAETLMNEIEKGFGEEPVLYDSHDSIVGNDLVWYLEQAGSYKQVRERDKERKKREMGFS